MNVQVRAGIAIVELRIYGIQTEKVTTVQQQLPVDPQKLVMEHKYYLKMEQRGFFSRISEFRSFSE